MSDLKRKTGFWSYRPTVEVIDGEDQWVVREVFFDGDGGVQGWTRDGVTAVGDTRAELIELLTLMLADATRAEPIRIDAEVDA